MEKHIEKSVENATIHVEAVEEPATMEEERRLVRKLDRRILPIICLLYLFSCERFLSSSRSSPQLVSRQLFLHVLCARQSLIGLIWETHG